MAREKQPLRVFALCRGEGVGYLAFCSDENFAGLTAKAFAKQGAEVPCELFPVSSASELESLKSGMRWNWVVVVPLLAKELEIRLLQDNAVIAKAAFPALRSKVTSRLLTMTKPDVVEILRGFEQRHGSGRTQAHIADAWPVGDGRVSYRVSVAFPVRDKSQEAFLEVFGTNGAPLDVPVVCLEDHVVGTAEDPSTQTRLVTFSCLMKQDVYSFFVRTWLGDERSYAGFAGMNAPRAAGMIEGARTEASGYADDSTYERWFEAHRASDADLLRQREAFRELPSDERPLISIVMPVFRTRAAFLQAAIDSVIAQSYEAWELVLVNASGPCADVDSVLAGVHDERIRIATVENRSISENTNVGIAMAGGSYVAFLDHDDVLEPDALWCLAQAIRSKPDADVLYTDEDHLIGSRVHAPAFKPGPNYGKLYSHNYVTHLLVVSRRVLGLTERSGADVAGAQDYDLTLKAFEVAREVVHVPRVLYHWREHDESTSSGSAQKPFAHEAGRAALAAHFGRRKIRVKIEDGVLPYTYRVRYVLPEKLPKVSIVIPTRDHADLLRACVASILDRSTYENYEILLVENGSEEEETFACYDELRASDERVRVVRWKPEVAGEFNFSAIVNFGARQATGEFLVLLNNDTEVIEPAWIEELLGCLMRPEVGVVGAKLLYGDDLIQHVFLSANPNGDFMHPCQNLARDALGPGYAASMPGDCSMVTGACQMMRRSLFESLGGYDERLAVGFNDGDFCLRVADEGYVITVATHALLYHREFTSRGRESQNPQMRVRYIAEKAYVMGKHPEFFAEGDPVVNPNLDRFNPRLSL